MRVDCHCDTVLHYQDNASLEHLPQAHLDFHRLRRYLDLSFFALWIDQRQFGPGSPAEFRRVWSLLEADLAAQEDMRLLRWAGQLEQPLHKLILIGMEGAGPLGEQGEFLDEYYQRGLRLLGLTWNEANAYGAGAFAQGGLTEEGGWLIGRCNELGILLDGAHLNDESFGQLLQISQAPCIDSHTACRSLCGDYPRSISDKQLEDLAQQGGVACICMVPDFLGGADAVTFCRHVEYAVSLVGASHVGLGADYDGCVIGPELAGAEHLPEIYSLLSSRGMKDEDLALVAGDSVWALLSRVLPQGGI